MDLTENHGSIRACMMRVAALSATGTTPSGGDMYVTTSLVELTLSPEVLDGDSIEQRNGCGDFCIDFKDDDRVRWWNAQLLICEPNAELSAMLVAGFSTFTDGPDTIGGKFPPLGRVVQSNGVSIELWSIRLDDDGQTRDGTFGYYQFAMPRTRGWRPADRAFTNAPLQNQFVGRVFMNDNWGNGPVNDWDVDTTETPLAYQVTNTLPSAVGLTTIPTQV